MRYMNSWDIARSIEMYRDHPVLGPATQTLANLAEWTDNNSDGWAYWPKPTRAAEKLMTLIQENSNPTMSEYQKAIRPVKSFRTRYNANFMIIA